MYKSIEQTIFGLIKLKDEESIKKLLKKGLVTQKIIDQERENYKKIYGQK